MSRKEFGDYYLGLDVGTDSVGWAVTDKDYRILTFNGKSMWGIHLFDSGNTAKSRRTQRISRRTLERRKKRIKLLQSLFSEEISKIDFTFFERLKDSRLFMEDRKHNNHYTLFNDPTFKDKDLYKNYPTIYHLREYLMTETPEAPDIRLLYLACHHIIKYRGHFLFDGNYSCDIPTFEILFEEAILCINDVLGTEISENTAKNAKEILSNRNFGMKEKIKELQKIIFDEEFPDAAMAFSTLISGGRIDLGELFSNDDLKKEKFTFKNTDFEEELVRLEGILNPNQILLLSHAKRVYDSVILIALMGNHSTISSAKVGQYNQHKRDLELLKMVLTNERKKYDEIFKSSSITYNYCAYVRSSKDRKSTVKPCTQSDFCKYIGTTLKDLFNDPVFDSGELADMKQRISEGTFMPKQVSKDNSIIPNALHLRELEKILEKASVHYPFLNEQDSAGKTIRDKIILLCEFKIPHYIGPLSKRTNRAWFEKKADGEITPWNFEEKVDIDKSADKFIGRLINKCSRIRTESVLPKCSLVYSRYELYDEINNIMIGEEHLDFKTKTELVRDLFENPSGTKKIKKKTIEDYLRQKGLLHRDDTISGIDDEIKSSLRSENLLKDIIDIKKNRRLAEEVIRIITVFNDPSRIKKKLYLDFKDELSDEQIAKLSKLQFKGWGKFSNKLLTGVYATIDGKEMNILTALEQTSLNFMKLMSRDLGFDEEIEKLRKNDDFNGKISYDLVKELPISPTVKRSIWRSMRIVEDILKITGHPPSKVFIETTRENKTNKKRTVSRKNKLIELYEACKDHKDILESIRDTSDAQLRSKKIYAYFTQREKCMYCGKEIDFEDLINNSTYDMDHIHPRSKRSDDSVHNNLVLVCKKHNNDKGDQYPLPAEWQQSMGPFWKTLKEMELITEEKYKRLVRKHEFSDDELAGFINRQLVETSQAVRTIAEIMKRLFDNETDVVYVKANTIDAFRNGQHGYKIPGTEENIKFIKCRSVNDFHHAKDAYLNIIVGNFFDVKFTKNFKNFVQSGEKWTLNMDTMLSDDIERNGVMGWKAGNDGTIATVRKYMKRNNILFTRFAYEQRGQLFDANPLRKTKGQLPLKKNLPIEKYGGYNNVVGSYFTLIEHKKGKAKAITIEAIPTHIALKGLSNEELLDYLRNEAGLEEPKILIPKIKKFSMFEINGTRAHISGRSGGKILYYNAEQLILSEEEYNYCKKIHNYITKNEKVTKNKKLEMSIPAYEFELTAEENIKLYDALTIKYDGPPYKNLFGKTSKTLMCCREKFSNLHLNDQTELLNELLKGLHCGPSGINLTAMGGPKETGKIQKSGSIMNTKSIKIIHQSPSGLFESVVNLKNI